MHLRPSGKLKWSVRDRIQEFLKSTGLIPQHARVLVGYSGGSDSTCLLHGLHSLGYFVIAAHLHHGMRSEADEELRHCEKFCKNLGIPFAFGYANVPQMSKELKIGLEEAGRFARYNFFEATQAKLECDLIATGHTRDDVAETMIFNLVRGTGLSGLTGIPSIRGQIVRPLLEFDRLETRQYCTENGLWFHDDPANSDLGNSRSRIRINVIPELEAINPELRSAMSRLAKLASQDDAVLCGLAARAAEQAELHLNGKLEFLTKDCEVLLDKGLLIHQPDSIKSRVVRLIASYLGSELNYFQTRAILDGIKENRGSITSDSGAIFFEWNDDSLHIRKSQIPQISRQTFDVPSKVEAHKFGWTLWADTSDSRSISRDPECLEVTLSTRAIKGQLHLRTALERDKIQPLGMTGQKLISDIFQEKRLTLAARKRLPIICDLIGPIWIPGNCIAERVKMTNNFEDCLVMRLTPSNVPKAEVH